MGFDFGAVLVFALVAIGFALGGITAARLLAPRAPSAEKASTYECGERPVGQAWFNFNPRFYLIALVFVIFEVDIALTFPVVSVFRAWVKEGPAFAWTALVELLLFTAVLVAALGWVWARGDLDCVKTLGARAAPGAEPLQRIEPTPHTGVEAVKDRPAA
jgi:NADH-quinone oxidoreductase subunit A